MAVTSHSIRSRLYRGVGGLLALVAASSVLGLVVLQRLSSSESKLADRSQPYLADLSTAAVAAADTPDQIAAFESAMTAIRQGFGR